MKHFLFSALFACLAIASARAGGPNPNGATTGFDPRTHGFNFPNNGWQGDVLIDIPILGKVNVGHARYGLCGGMSMAACDTFLLHGTCPDLTTPPGADYPPVPEPGTPMRGYVFSRQIDSFRDNDAFLIRRLMSWIPKPMKTNVLGTGLHVLSDRRFKRTIAPEIDAGRPVPLCLVKDSANDLIPTNLGQFSADGFQKNHQVLAIAYRLHVPPEGPKHWDIDIYDPNFPNQIHTLHYHKSFRVQTRRTWANGQLVADFDRIDKNITGHFRAFFNTPYDVQRPPWVPAGESVTARLSTLHESLVNRPRDDADAN